MEELSEEELDALVGEATILGVTVIVKGVTQTASGIVADCVRGSHHQAIDVLDLPLPEPPPKGAEWVAAYRYLARLA